MVATNRRNPSCRASSRSSSPGHLSASSGRAGRTFHFDRLRSSAVRCLQMTPSHYVTGVLTRNRVWRRRLEIALSSMDKQRRRQGTFSRFVIDKRKRTWRGTDRRHVILGG
jgi:hypothetical protein